MLQSLNLHRAGNRADWEKVPANKRNIWQKVAASTSGVVTPANLISAIGAVITIIGLVGLVNDPSLLNISLVIGGRLADIADGYVAQKTMTKSPLGEVIDASVDKLLAFIAVLALAVADLAPLVIIVLILLYSIFNSIVSAAAKLQNKPIHPSREGKFAGAACWGVIIFYPLNSLLKDNSESTAIAALLIALLFTASFIWYGLRSMSEYFRLWRAGV
jgi:phosphatidylglycerophosphate synthase